MSLLIACSSANADEDSTNDELARNPAGQGPGLRLESGGLTVHAEFIDKDNRRSVRTVFARGSKKVTMPCYAFASARESGAPAVAVIECDALISSSADATVGSIKIEKTGHKVQVNLHYAGRSDHDVWAKDFELISGRRVGERGALDATLEAQEISSSAAETDPLALAGRVANVLGPMAGQRVRFGYSREDTRNGREGAYVHVEVEETLTKVDAHITDKMHLALSPDFAEDRNLLHVYKPDVISLLVGEGLGSGIIDDAELERRISQALKLAR